MRAPLIALLLGGAVLAQEAINTNAATQPGTGRVIVREQLRFFHASEFPSSFAIDRADELVFASSLSLGLRHDVAVTLDLPASLRWSDRAGGGSDDDGDFGDLRAVGKWRVLRNDGGPIDTERVALLFGVQLDTGSGTSLRPGFTRDSNDPILGAVYTRVSGRHGVNGALEYTISTSGHADDLRYDAAYLFRTTPSEYRSDTTAATYAVLELNGTWATDGDDELLVSPGFMYEARRWTFEASLQLPLVQDLDRRPEIDVGVVVGVRLLF